MVTIDDIISHNAAKDLLQVLQTDAANKEATQLLKMVQAQYHNDLEHTTMEMGHKNVSLLLSEVVEVCLESSLLSSSSSLSKAGK